MARKTRATRKIEEVATVVTDAESATTEAIKQAEPAQSNVDPYPRNIRKKDFGGYVVRLNQDRQTDEMRIQFGSGRKADKPSEEVLDVLRNALVPQELQTRKEREEGKKVPWFKFREDPDTGVGSWRMWLRNHSHTARAKAEEVFETIVEQISQEMAAGRSR